MLVLLTRLDFYHSFRPPIETELLVNVDEVSSISEGYIDHYGSCSQVKMKDGTKFIVTESPEVIFALLKKPS